MNYVNEMVTFSNGFSLILKVLLISIGAYIIIKLLYKGVNRIERKYDLDMTVVYILNDCFKYFVIIIAIAWILELFGIDIKGIVISLGIAGVALGIAAKDVVSNFLSGIFVLSDKSIRVGEVISIEQKKGTVKKIGFRTTTLINQDKQIITIPNSLFDLHHYTKYLPLEDYRININAALPHNANLTEFEKEVTEAIYKYDWVNKEHGLLIRGDVINEDGPVMIISIWVNSYEMLDPGKIIIMNDINQLIHKKYSKKPSKKVKRRKTRKDKINIKEEIERLEKEMKSIEMEINYLHEKDDMIEEKISEK